jgi:ribonuclease Z
MEPIQGTGPGGVPMKNKGWILFVSGFAACLAVVIGCGLLTDGPEAEAKASPVKALEDREVYYPGTEDLAPDEMRVTACGTGMPSVRPKQAAACWLVELGNGDKFMFDIGAQSMSRIAAMKIPMDYLDKVFIGHLHTDHMGDLPILWTGSRKMNRTVPLRVWGPSGESPEMGITAAIEGLKQFLLWDDVSLQGRLDARAGEWEVNEFDYKGVNEIIYSENGVTIRSIPAIHSLDGSVSFILDWNGLKFAYSSDTFPNKWWIEHTKGVDISVHECFAPPEVLVEKQNYDPGFAVWLSTLAHTSPAQFGKIMAMTEPRMAVGYHFYNDHDTLPVVLQSVHTTYDGPVTLATDYMVFNVTRENIRVRMAAVDQDIWPLPPTRPKVVKKERQVTYGEFTKSGEVMMRDVLEQVWCETSEKYGIDAKLP